MKKEIAMRVVFLNTSILTSEGQFHYRKVSTEFVKQAISLSVTQLSAVGHEATAKVMSDILDFKIPMNRIQYEQELGDICICFKLRTRLLEGRVLNEEELKELEYDLFLLVDNTTLQLTKDALGNSRGDHE